jgi:hypothetical protein
MFARDAERLADVRKRCNRLPLGAAALAGTSYPLDREAVAAALGFDGVCENSLDAVSDRDFAMEFLAQQNRRVAGETVDAQISATGKHVIVIGGGDTGSDCVGTSNRHGAQSVTQFEVMPMPPEHEDKAVTWPWPVTAWLATPTGAAHLGRVDDASTRPLVACTAATSRPIPKRVWAAGRPKTFGKPCTWAARKTDACSPRLFPTTTPVW